jgi:hypothetical protein
MWIYKDMHFIFKLDQKFSYSILSIHINNIKLHKLSTLFCNKIHVFKYKLNIKNNFYMNICFILVVVVFYAIEHIYI